MDTDLDAGLQFASNSGGHIPSGILTLRIKKILVPKNFNFILMLRYQNFKILGMLVTNLIMRPAALKFSSYPNGSKSSMRQWKAEMVGWPNRLKHSICLLSNIPLKGLPRLHLSAIVAGSPKCSWALPGSLRQTKNLGFVGVCLCSNHSLLPSSTH